jgi:hypothetical protein
VLKGSVDGYIAGRKMVMVDRQRALPRTVAPLTFP